MVVRERITEGRQAAPNSSHESRLGSPPTLNSKSLNAIDRLRKRGLITLVDWCPDTDDSYDLDLVPGGRVISYVGAAVRSTYDPQERFIPAREFRQRGKACISLLNQNPRYETLGNLLRAIKEE